jgi:hypothetical protein
MCYERVTQPVRFPSSHAAVRLSEPLPLWAVEEALANELAKLKGEDDDTLYDSLRLQKLRAAAASVAASGVAGNMLVFPGSAFLWNTNAYTRAAENGHLDMLQVRGGGVESVQLSRKASYRAVLRKP